MRVWRAAARPRSVHLWSRCTRVGTTSATTGIGGRYLATSRVVVPRFAYTTMSPACQQGRDCSADLCPVLSMNTEPSSNVVSNTLPGRAVKETRVNSGKVIVSRDNFMRQDCTAHSSQ